MPRLDIALERLRKGGVDRAWVQADDDRAIVAAPFFDRDRADHLIQRGLGGAVAMPAAELVVRDAADACRQHCEHAATGPRHQRQEMLCDHGGPDRIDREDARHPAGIKLLQRLFRAKLSFMQEPGCDDDQDGGRAVRHQGRRSRDAGLIFEIEVLLARTRPGKAVDLVERALFDQRGLERPADPAGGADNDGNATHPRTNCQRSGSLASASKR